MNGDPRNPKSPAERGKAPAPRQVLLKRIILIAPIVALLLWVIVPRFTTPRPKPFVVVYCAQDQVYAEPVLVSFERQTGIRVRPVFDSEAVKTVGLANRLLAEQARPQCDVFWGNEEMRARQLAARGVFVKTNGLALFGYRSRRIVVNTNRVTLAEVPRTLAQLTEERWRGKVAIAYPQFGTTATHFHALRQAWGTSSWEQWCRALAANKALLVDGNSAVVRLVGRGEALIGLTDSDDIAAGIREGLPIAASPLSPELLLIPNAIGLVHKAPHPKAAQRLFEFLQEREVVERMIAAQALEGFSMNEVTETTLKVDWNALLRDLESTTDKLNDIFLK